MSELCTACDGTGRSKPPFDWIWCIACGGKGTLDAQRQKEAEEAEDKEYYEKRRKKRENE